MMTTTSRIALACALSLGLAAALPATAADEAAGRYADWQAAQMTAAKDWTAHMESLREQQAAAAAAHAAALRKAWIEQAEALKAIHALEAADRAAGVEAPFAARTPFERPESLDDQARQAWIAERRAEFETRRAAYERLSEAQMAARDALRFGPYGRPGPAFADVRDHGGPVITEREQADEAHEKARDADWAARRAAADRQRAQAMAAMEAERKAFESFAVPAYRAAPSNAPWGPTDGDREAFEAARTQQAKAWREALDAQRQTMEKWMKTSREAYGTVYGLPTAAPKKADTPT